MDGHGQFAGRGGGGDVTAAPDPADLPAGGGHPSTVTENSDPIAHDLATMRQCAALISAMVEAKKNDLEFAENHSPIHTLYQVTRDLVESLNAITRSWELYKHPDASVEALHDANPYLKIDYNDVFADGFRELNKKLSQLETEFNQLQMTALQKEEKAFTEQEMEVATKWIPHIRLHAKKLEANIHAIINLGTDIKPNSVPDGPTGPTNHQTHPHAHPSLVRRAIHGVKGSLSRAINDLRAARFGETHVAARLGVIPSHVREEGLNADWRNRVVGSRTDKEIG